MPDSTRTFVAIALAGLELAAESYKRKRMAHQKMPRPGWIARLFR